MKNVNQVTSYEQIPLYLNADELARTLGIPKSSAYSLLNSQGFPMCVIAGKKMVRKEKMLEWIAEQENDNKAKTFDGLKRRDRHGQQ